MLRSNEVLIYFVNAWSCILNHNRFSYSNSYSCFEFDRNRNSYSYFYGYRNTWITDWNTNSNRNSNRNFDFHTYSNKHGYKHLDSNIYHHPNSYSNSYDTIGYTRNPRPVNVGIVDYRGKCRWRSCTGFGGYFGYRVSAETKTHSFHSDNDECTYRSKRESPILTYSISSWVDYYD